MADSRSKGPAEEGVADDIIARLRECDKRIGDICAERRGPRMSIPADPNDDDLFICATVEEAAAELARLRQENERIGNFVSSSCGKVRKHFERAEQAEAALASSAASLKGMYVGRWKCFECGTSCDSPMTPKGSFACSTCGAYDLMPEAVAVRVGAAYDEEHTAKEALSQQLDEAREALPSINWLCEMVHHVKDTAVKGYWTETDEANMRVLERLRASEPKEDGK